jgi:streptomycin 6-kinase
VSGRKLEVPEAVYKKVITLGETGQIWLDNLDDLIHGLERDWRIKVGKALSGGSEAFVAEAVDENNTEVILKIAMPVMPGNTAFENEVKALTLVDGKGYVRLLKFDIERRALLLERLGKSLRSLDLPSDTQIEIICRTLEKTWVHIPEQTQVFTGDGIFTEFRALIIELCKDANVSFSEETVNKALQYCESRAAVFDSERAVLVHGDAHSDNLLQVIPTNNQTPYQFKLIDPDGILCEPAYDLGVLMREWIDELLEDPIRLGCKRCEYISRLTNVNPKAIWEWGFIQCVATGLLLAKVGQEQEGSKLLTVADSWADGVME